MYAMNTTFETIHLIGLQIRSLDRWILLTYIFALLELFLTLSWIIISNNKTRCVRRMCWMMDNFKTDLIDFYKTTNDLWEARTPWESFSRRFSKAGGFLNKEQYHCLWSLFLATVNQWKLFHLYQHIYHLYARKCRQEFFQQAACKTFWDENQFLLSWYFCEIIHPLQLCCPTIVKLAEDLSGCCHQHRMNDVRDFLPWGGQNLWYSSSKIINIHRKWSSSCTFFYPA